MTFQKALFLLASVLFLCASCRKDEHYYLTDEAEAFLLYEEGDTFKLRNESTGEIILLTVDSKVFTFEESSPPIAHFSFGPGGDIFKQKGVMTFSGGAYFGEITVWAENHTEFAIYISMYGDSGNKGYDGGSFYDSDIMGIGYTDYYIFNGWPGRLMFSKQFGILSIDNEDLSPDFTRVE